jgi:hypothetical protein
LEPPYDQERDPDDDEVRRILLWATIATAAIIAALIVGLFLNGCAFTEPTPPTLPPINAPTTTTTMLDG